MAGDEQPGAQALITASVLDDEAAAHRWVRGGLDDEPHVAATRAQSAEQRADARAPASGPAGLRAVHGGRTDGAPPWT